MKPRTIAALVFVALMILWLATGATWLGTAVLAVTLALIVVYGLTRFVVWAARQ